MNSFFKEIDAYYSGMIEKYGDSPCGVNWNSLQGQTKRFEQLCKVIHPTSKEFSINDLGCGYGALLDHLNKNKYSFSYVGIDISENMIKKATQRYIKSNHARFIRSSEPDQFSDYGIASGIFNVRLKKTDHEWTSYFNTSLDILNQTSRLGFSFNCLSSFSDKDKQLDHLYYADPCTFFNLCKQQYSQNVSLLHDYGLYEFTIIVRKDS